jgi:hypothetical protein
VIPIADLIDNLRGDCLLNTAKARAQQSPSVRIL